MSNTTMTPLPQVDIKLGHTFTQLRRAQDVVLMENKSPYGAVSLEVIKVRKYPTHERAPGVIIEAHEAMPPNESWGEEGWTYTPASHGKTYEQEAQAKFAEVLKSNPYSPVQGVPTGEPRGRKRADFEIDLSKLPAKEFTMRDVANLHPDKSVPFLHLRVNELIERGKVRLVEKRKVIGARGKAPNIYSLV